MVSRQGTKRQNKTGRIVRISPVTFKRIGAVSVACFALLVVTGGAVRLTGSGLGCLDWPTCSAHDLIASDSFHPLVEFSNRLVTVAVTIISFVALGAAIRRLPKRRDLLFCASGLVIGIAAQIVLGGLVVLTKLNPYLVGLHFILTLAILADAVVMYHRAGHDDTAGEPLVGRELIFLVRALVITISVLVVVGTTVTGAGPHAGGVGAKRIPIAFSTIAEAHSGIALFLIGMTLGTLFALRYAKAPAIIQHRAGIVFEILIVQGTLGFTQYFLHDNALVVEFHLAGATSAWCAMVTFYLFLFQHPATERAVDLSSSVQTETIVRDAMRVSP